MNYRKIGPFENEQVQAVIETPKGSSYKYDFDPVAAVFRLDKILPFGMYFPFDFGFIPGTKGEDGDPLDIMLLMEQSNLQGVVVLCRVVAVMKSVQTERDGTKFRNDRFLAVSSLSPEHEHTLNVEDISTRLLEEIAYFFKQYNELAGKTFQVLAWEGRDEARRLIISQQI